MYPFPFSFSLFSLLLCLFRVGNSAPNTSLDLNTAAHELDDTAPTEFTVYFCENINWAPPCHLYPLSPTDPTLIYDWKEERNISFWPDGSWTVGSLGPAAGLTVTVYNPYEQTQAEWTYPGTPDVGDYWAENIYTFGVAW